MFASRPRRNSLLVSTAILLAGAPNYSHAHNLRRSSEAETNIESSSATVGNLDTEGEGKNGGFEVVGGALYHSTKMYELRRSTVLIEEEMKPEDVVEPIEYVDDESIVFVSAMIVLLTSCHNKNNNCPPSHIYVNLNASHELF